MRMNTVGKRGFVTRISLFLNNPVLKLGHYNLMLYEYPHTKCCCGVMEKILSEITNQISFLVTFAGRVLKLEDVGPSFNPCPFLPSVATDDRKQFQYLNIILAHTTEPLSLEFD